MAKQDVLARDWKASPVAKVCTLTVFVWIVNLTISPSLLASKTLTVQHSPCSASPLTPFSAWKYINKFKKRSSYQSKQLWFISEKSRLPFKVIKSWKLPRIFWSFDPETEHPGQDISLPRYHAPFCSFSRPLDESCCLSTGPPSSFGSRQRYDYIA